MGVMVPGSVTRSVNVPMSGSAPVRSVRGPWHPANVPFAVSAELRAFLLWMAFIGALGVVLALGHVWIRNQVVEAGYRLSATRQLVERLQLEGRELAVLAAAADAPGRLEELARTRIGMRAPLASEEVILP
jgi:cell division protein FtsL